MNLAGIPTRFNIPWANAAGGSFIRPIPQASQIGIQNGAASLTDGFPPLTFQPVASGGVPPFGEDMNGILNQITLWNQWQAAGGAVLFDGIFATAVGGYPKGAVLQSTTANLQWYNTTDGNVTDPDGGGPVGWLALGPKGIQRQGGNYAVATGTNAYAITLNPPPLTYAELVGVPLRVKFANASTNTGVSLNVNALGAKTILRPPPQPQVFFGDVVANAIYNLTYDGINFQLTDFQFASISGSGIARQTVVPNTSTATDIFAAVQGECNVAYDFGGGNAFCDSILWYQGGAIDVRRAGVGAPGTRTYSLTSSVLQLALSGAPGAATVSPFVLQSVGPTP